MAVDVTIETRDALRRKSGETVLGLIKPTGVGFYYQLLKPFQLFGGNDAVEQSVVVGLGNLFAARDIAEVRPGR